MRLRATPDRRRAVRLERYDIDRVARAVAAGRHGLGARLDGFVDAIAVRMTAKLAAAGVQIRRRTLRRPRVDLDRETRSLIVARVSKHLPTIDDATSNGSTRRR
jgi:uncharacterized protein with GYD domain